MIRNIFFLLILGLCLTATRLQAQVVKLSVITASNSILAAEAQEIINGTKLAIQQVNNNSGLKFGFEVELHDSQLDPSAVEGIISKLNDTNYIIGFQIVRELQQIADLAVSQRKVIISPAIRSDLSGMQNDFIFRTRHTQKQEAEFFSRYIYQSIGRMPLSSIILDSDAGATQIKLFKPAYDSLGGKFGFFDDLYLDRPDYQALIQKLQVNNAKALYTLGLSVQVADIISEASFAGLQLKMFGSSDNHNQIIIERAGKAAEGFTIPYPFDFEGNPQSAAFARDYAMQFNQFPGYIAANAYDAVRVLSACLEKVGDNPSAVKSCLYYIRDFDGAGGKFSIDRNGNSHRELFVKAVRNGKFKKIQ